MIAINNERCNGCGLCKSDCLTSNIAIQDEKAVGGQGFCIKCGHCLAICPENAVSILGYNAEDVIERGENAFSLDADNLLNAVKFRRSVRHFTKEAVSADKIHMILESARYTPTAVNAQDISYIVVTDRILELKKAVAAELAVMAAEIRKSAAPTAVDNLYADMWEKIYTDVNTGSEVREALFCNAPTAIMVVSDYATQASITNASLASATMEIMTNALGLGGFFVAFAVKAAKRSTEVRRILDMNDNQMLTTVLCIGHPDPEFSYLRTVPRADLRAAYI